MSIGVPIDIGKFGLEFARDYRQLVEAVNRIFEMNLPRAPSYTVATLPAATDVSAGSLAYVSDAAGSPCIAFSNGTVWKRCDDATVTVT